MPHELAQRGPARGPLDRGTALILDVGSSGLDDPAVWHTRWTNALTGAAAETEVDVLHLLFVELQRPALPLSHEVDAAARRLGLESGDAEGGAGVAAEATVDTGGEVVIGQPREGGCQTTYLPGFNMPYGSNAYFRRLVRSIVCGVPTQPP